jgi:hypothetical protein
VKDISRKRRPPSEGPLSTEGKIRAVGSEDQRRRVPPSVGTANHPGDLTGGPEKDRRLRGKERFTSTGLRLGHTTGYSTR